VKKFLLLISMVLVFSACGAKIPSESIALNQNVTTGIEALRQNALDIIKAWEEVANSTIDEKWSELYSRAEDMFWKKRTLAPTGPTQEQLMEIAGLAGRIKDKLREVVRDKANEMRRTVMENAEATLKMNNGVTDLLSSARRVIETNEALLDTIKDMVPIPLDLLEVK
jgi:hypothetical protein